MSDKCVHSAVKGMFCYIVDILKNTAEIMFWLILDKAYISYYKKIRCAALNGGAPPRPPQTPLPGPVGAASRPYIEPILSISILI